MYTIYKHYYQLNYYYKRDLSVCACDCVQKTFTKYMVTGRSKNKYVYI